LRPSFAGGDNIKRGGALQKVEKMGPTEELVKEHEAINLMVDILEKICIRLESGKKVNQGDLAQVIEFAKGFVDRCHHKKEEDVLFPAMENSQIYRKGGIRDHLEDHKSGRKYVGSMNDALLAYTTGNPNALPKFTENARNYIALLRRHIDSENNLLFPAAEEYIPEGKKEKIVARFGEIELGQGDHDRLLKVLGSLKKAYLEQD